MSNGRGPLGSVDIKQDEGLFRVFIGEAWTSAENWVLVSLDLNGESIASLDIDPDDARQIAALLLQGAGCGELAKSIPADIARRAEIERQRHEASMKLREAKDAAAAAFRVAAADQLAVYNAAIDEAELAYGASSGERCYRSIAVSDLEPMF